jgi:hypothetical protein
MIINNAEQKFEAMGARFRTISDSIMADFSMNVTKDDTGESFEFRAARASSLEVTVADVQPDKRHLLMFVRDKTKPEKEQVDRFLCGHDERAWFVAAVPRKSINGDSSNDSLTT